MSKPFSIKFSDEDMKMLEELRQIYGFKTKSQLIKHLILWHYKFWKNRDVYDPNEVTDEGDTFVEIKPKFTAVQKAYLLHALCLELNDVEEEYKDDVEALIHNIASMDVLNEDN